ncbi:MAG: patatin-like phospholipase family protein [Candidatus Dormibacteria bacterium]
MEERTGARIETVLVLGGGGGRGAAQLGILRALAERGLEPDACVGTSVGALNAAVVASRPLTEALDMLEQIWASPQTRAVFRARPLRMVLNRVRRHPWLRSDDAVGELVDFATAMTGIESFEELRRPLEIIVTDLLTGEPVVISQGPLRDPLRASCAIPFVFQPVRLGDRSYVDGGVTDNCSLSTAVRMGPSRIIAVDLTAELAMPALRRLSDVFQRVTSVALHARLLADFDRFSRHLPVTLICPRIPNPLRVADFSKVREAARTAMESLLQTIGLADGRLAPGLFYLPLSMEGSPAAG